MKELRSLLVPALVGVMCACGTRIGDGGDAVSEPGIAVPPSSGGFFGGATIGGAFPQAAGPSGRPLRLTDLRTAATPPPTISGGSLAVSADGKQVVAADPDRDAVYVVDVEALTVKTLRLPAGSEPGRVALDRSGGAHVALRGGGKLLRVNLAAGDISTETSICAQPRGVAYDAANDQVVTSCMDGQLVTLDAASHREATRQTLPQDLRDVIVSQRGERWVTRYRSAELLTLNGTDVKATSRPAKAHSISFNFARTPIDSNSGSTDPGAFGPKQITSSPTLAWRAIPTKQGNVMMLHQQSQDDEVVISAGGYGSGCQTITNGAVTEFDPQGQPTRTMGVSLLGLTVDAAISPDNQWLATASPGAFVRGMPSIQVYPTSAMQAPTEPEPTPNGGNPVMIAGGPCSAPAQTAGSENQTIAVAFDGNGVLYALSREPAELQVFELKSIAQVNGFGAPTIPALTRRATVALSAKSARDTGHDLFHADVGQGLACASCHGEALDDGHVWNFQKIGPRRTQNMRGGFLKTAPFHWDGDMGSIGHLVEDVMTGRMGGFPVESSFSAALGSWIDQQPALSLPAHDLAAVARGKTVFESDGAKCATCHTGSNFTNNQSYDVGTGGTFQVPGLLGLALRAPFMHNGCAGKLEDRFDPACGGGDKHGRTSQLSEGERDDLVAYLSSL